MGIYWDKNKKKYGIVSLIIFVTSIIILAVIDRTNNINLSLAIQVIIILYLSKFVYGSIIYIKDQYLKQKYSYDIIMTLGYVLFLIVNIERQINLLIINRTETNIVDLYNNTLQSFSYFAMLTLPLIIILAIYSIITNIMLIKREGFAITNLLGIIFGFITLLCTIGAQFVYRFMAQLDFSASGLIIKRFIDISLNLLLTYYYCLIIATLYCNIMAAKHNPKYDKDFVIILGSRIKKDGSLTNLLKGRVDRALLFAKNQKEETKQDIYYVPSGGQGSDEIMPEGEAIKKYLTENGVPENRIIVEGKSTNTFENMRFSKEKIDKVNKDGKIAFSTTNYHVFRSGVVANEEGIDCEGMGSPTKWYFYTNALIREFFANLHNQRWKHFILITSVNIIMLGLVLIGYYNNLLV